MAMRVRESSLPSGSSSISRRRLVDQRARQRRALRHAAGELVRIGLGEVVRPTSSSASSTRAALLLAAGRAPPGPSATLLPHGAPGIERRVLEHHDARRVGPGDLRAVDQQAVPAVGGSRPATSRSSVDLPQPLGPSRATNSPGSTSKVDVVEHRQRLAVELEGVADAARRRGDAGRLGRGGVGLAGSGYHCTSPFCQASRRSRSRNSSVIRPEHISAITSSAAYMLA